MVDLLAKLEAISDRFREVEKSIGDPDLIANNDAYRDAMREYRRLEPIAEHSQLFRAVWDDLAQAKEWANSDDADYREMGSAEISPLQAKLEELVITAREMLLPHDEADERDVVSYTQLRAHETVLELVCRFLLEKKKTFRDPCISNHPLTSHT